MNKPILAHVPANELTFEERYHVLRRLRFWGDLFAQFAEENAGGYEAIKSLTAKLNEKGFLPYMQDFAEQCERVLMNERDPVKLWRYAIAAENHRVAFLETTEKLFPEKKKQLRYFHIYWYLPTERTGKNAPGA